MKKIFLVAIILIGGLSELIGSPALANAMPTHKHAPLGSYFGISSATWNGGTLGVKSTFFLDNPGLADGGEWFRAIDLYTSDYSRSARFGIDKCNDSLNCLCPTFGRSALYVFTDAEQTSAATCFEIAQNNDNINKQCTFAITENSSGNGVEYQMSCPFSDHPCTGVGCSEYFTLPAWGIIGLTEYINNIFTGHNVWGGSWTQNQYQSTRTKAWVYQSRNTDTLSADNPPQMYWHQVPAPGNNGGVLYSCDYSSGTTCNYRS